MQKAAIALLGFIGCLAEPALAQQSVADFYKGNTVRIVVGVAVGSGYDINARLLARHLGAHIPGKPAVVVQNQPGAGSMAMTNQLYANGPFDGTVIGAPFNGLPTAPLLTPEGARFEATKLIWIGSTNKETQVTYLWHTAPAQSLEDLRSKETVVGAQAPGSTQYDYAVLANQLFGFKFKVVTGYDGTPKIHLAMERGEVHGIAATNWSTLKAIGSDWLRDKKVKVIAQWGLTPHPDLAAVASMLDLAKTPADRQALELSLARLEYGRPFFLPPNVPPERVEALRRAFDATMKDPAYLAEAATAKVDVDPLTGEQVATLVERVSRTPTDTVMLVRKALANK